MAQNLVGGSKCRICSKYFAGPEDEFRGAMLLNPKANARLAKYIKRLVAHLAEAHAERFQEITFQQAEYFGLLCLMTFDSTDEEVAKERDEMRWKLAKAMRRATVTDDRIRERVEELLRDILSQVKPTIKTNDDLVQLEALVDIVVIPRVTRMVCEMRDVLEERGRPVPNALVDRGGI